MTSRTLSTWEGETNRGERGGREEGGRREGGGREENANVHTMSHQSGRVYECIVFTIAN